MTPKWNFHPNACLWNKANQSTNNFNTFIVNSDKNWIKLFLFEIRSCNKLNQETGKCRFHIYFVLIFFLKWIKTSYIIIRHLLDIGLISVSLLHVDQCSCTRGKIQSSKPTRLFTEKFKRRLILTAKLITLFSKGNTDLVFPYIFRLEYSSSPLQPIALLQVYSHVVFKL